MAPTFAQLADDLRAESDQIIALIDPLTPQRWNIETPAPGWTITDQIAHLAFFDDMATLGAFDPDEFRRQRAAAMADPVGIVDSAAQALRGKPCDEVYAWFVASRVALINAYAALPEGTRVPWYGPDMSAASKITARIMETWAHGQDISDALGVVRTPTRALRNVAHIGVRTMANSFRTVGLDVPEVEVSVVLSSPDGATWTWGPAPEASSAERASTAGATGGAAATSANSRALADDSISGSALDFCLVTTQRRHVDDTALVVRGAVAHQWMSVAQAFAGPPGRGRTRGQFAQ